ncbi:alpha/beta fold hydrolase [Streptomyces sp. AC550_RSS872]|uniref:alpha/beta fold hydrolase n=1 Tax=Streptomyces sp. AC550_RSS872 TaxID=2823689 RepID=UPI001C270252|nr:alpha/beta hydrolase [Streptomyces sp. AC550_RSS872]
MTTSTPTVVLVHGAFADSAGWIGVIAELHSHGIPVIAPPNPLRGLAADATYIASVASQIDGPVILVGHSYGGALITVAGTTENVVGLVYVAAVLEEGESLGELQGRFPTAPLVSSLKQWTYPVEGGAPAVEVTIDADAFPSVFAADVPADLTKVLAWPNGRWPPRPSRRRPPRPRGRPSRPGLLVAGADEAINPEVQRYGARRAGATVVEIKGASHAIAVSQPTEVADVIRDAVRATS